MKIEVLVERLLPNSSAKEYIGFIEVDGVILEIDSVEVQIVNQSVLIKSRRPAGAKSGPIDRRKRVVDHYWEGLKCVLTLECGCQTYRYQAHMQSGVPKKILCKECG